VRGDRVVAGHGQHVTDRSLVQTCAQLGVGEVAEAVVPLSWIRHLGVPEPRIVNEMRWNRLARAGSRFRIGATTIGIHPAGPSARRARPLRDRRPPTHRGHSTESRHGQCMLIFKGAGVSDCLPAGSVRTTESGLMVALVSSSPPAVSGVLRRSGQFRTKPAGSPRHGPARGEIETDRTTAPDRDGACPRYGRTPCREPV
jgi:hypothetical protein